jgi:hypothetical protein
MTRLPHGKVLRHPKILIARHTEQNEAGNGSNELAARKVRTTETSALLLRIWISNMRMAHRSTCDLARGRGELNPGGKPPYARLYVHTVVGLVLSLVRGREVQISHGGKAPKKQWWTLTEGVRFPFRDWSVVFRCTFSATTVTAWTFAKKPPPFPDRETTTARGGSVA